MVQVYNCVCISTLQLSILVHPDKNESDRDRAQLAFDGIYMYICMYVSMLTVHIACIHVCAAVHKAYKMLQEEEQKGYVLEIVEDAKAMLDMKVLYF